MGAIALPDGADTFAWQVRPDGALAGDLRDGLTGWTLHNRTWDFVSVNGSVPDPWYAARQADVGGNPQARALGDGPPFAGSLDPLCDLLRGGGGAGMRAGGGGDGEVLSEWEEAASATLPTWPQLNCTNTTTNASYDCDDHTATYDSAGFYRRARVEELSTWSEEEFYCTARCQALRLLPLWVFLAGLLGFALPYLNAREKRKKRHVEILRQLPVFLDYLAMSIQAGANFTGAIRHSVEKGPEGPMKAELNKVMRDIRAGMGRFDALRLMAERVDVDAVQTFVNAVVQAERTGASIGDVLKGQADQRRTERFQLAEKLAMQAPVKLILPLVAFIFPTTFLIIGFPIAMKLWEVFR